MGRLALAVVILGILVLAQIANAAAPRVALVVGNSAYAEAPLANPANDARLIAETLRGLSFDVIELIDANLEEIQLATFELQDQLFAAGKDAVGLFYYAGHGIQVGGQNYLIPLNSHIEKEREVAIKAVSANFVLKQMEFAGNRINFVILDACRNNPLSRSFRSADRGLARMDAPRGSLVAYSTGPGEVAADGMGVNSPYTLALARVMQVPGVPAEKMFKLVRDSVMDATSGDQTPWEESSLTGDDFYFAVAAQITVEAPTTAESSFDERQLDLSFWNSIKSSNNSEMYEEYLAQFPDGTFAGLAKLKLSALRANDAQRLAAEEEARRQAEATAEAEHLAAEEEARRQAEAEAERLAAELETMRQFEAVRLAEEEIQRKAAEEEVNRQASELTFWDAIKDSANAADYEAYVEQYPNGTFATLARNRLAMFKAGEVPATVEQQQASLPDPTEETPGFDGEWEMVINNEGCTQLGRAGGTIVAADSKLSGSFRVGMHGTFQIHGTILPSGELAKAYLQGRYYVKLTGKIAGDEGQGRWSSGSSCDGTFSLARTGSG